jgi:hypothetical protein
VEQYAAVELFRGTMVRHSVIVYPNNRDRDPFLPDFTGDAWLNYVPIRMSDTICVQEQMPPGAAALLINQSHTFRDLLMPIDATEKRLFDAIDGNRSISEIVEGRPLDLARRLFERLWRHDQVVFDASYSHKVPMVPNENGETTV